MTAPRRSLAWIGFFLIVMIGVVLSASACLYYSHAGVQRAADSLSAGAAQILVGVSQSAQHAANASHVSAAAVRADAGGALASPSGFDASSLFVVAAVFVAAGISFVVWRGGRIEEIFLVHWSGVLIVHLSKTIKTSTDRDILAGMLTTIQQFAREAFVGWKGRDIRRIDLGKQKIFLSRGSFSYLAAVVRGRKPGGLDSRMARAVAEFEGIFEGKLEEWDGVLETLVGAEDVLSEAVLRGSIVRFSRWIARNLRPSELRHPLSLSAHMQDRRRASQSKRAGLRRVAARLRQRAELGEMEDEYQEMVATALEEMSEGRFTVCGFANIYLATVRYDPTGNKVEAWWAAVLQLTRDVLHLWKWDPESQAWTSERDESAQSGRSEAELRALEAKRAEYLRAAGISAPVAVLKSFSTAEDA